MNLQNRSKIGPSKQPNRFSHTGAISSNVSSKEIVFHFFGGGILWLCGICLVLGMDSPIEEVSVR